MYGRRKAFIQDYTEKLVEEGFVVYSDLPGYLPPPTVGSYRPDILARNISQRRFITVKPAKTYDRDSPELSALRQYSQDTPGVSFTVFTVDENGESRLEENTENPEPKGQYSESS